MQRRNARDRSGLPIELLRPTPRHVRPNAVGWLTLISAAALVFAGFWGGSDLLRRSMEANRRVALFASEATATTGDVVRVQKRGDEDDRRSVVHYRYLVAGEEFIGAVTARRQDNERYAAGARVQVRYLRSEPGASWLDGYAPRRRSSWPSFAVPAATVIVALALVLLIRWQTHLLADGRPALAVVTRVEKKLGEHGTTWRVHYEWRLLSGAKRTGRYDHSRKNPPAVGTPMPVVYDKDTERSMRYPLALVRL